MNSHLLAQAGVTATIMVNRRELGFAIPTLTDILTFAIRGFFVLIGIVALIMLLLGALAWVTSGGSKDAVSKAQNKIQAAVVGVLLVAVVLAIVVTLEQVVFQGRLCLGLSCPITIPALLGPPRQGVVQPTSVPVVSITPSISPAEMTITPIEGTGFYQQSNETLTPSYSGTPTPFIPQVPGSGGGGGILPRTGG